MNLWLVAEAGSDPLKPTVAEVLDVALGADRARFVVPSVIQVLRGEVANIGSINARFGLRKLVHGELLHLVRSGASRLARITDM